MRLPPLTRPQRALAWLAALAFVALAVRELAHRAAGAEWFRNDAVTQWIWREGDLRSLGSTAFFAVREVDLDRVPDGAIASVLGDEEYLLYLNGTLIGAGGWRPGALADRYAVSPWLRPGRNRLVAELRSSTGAGGFWLELADPSGRVLARTDDAWRRFDGAWHGLFRETPLVEAAPLRGLGSGAVGRWSLLAGGPLRAPLEERLRGEPRRALAMRIAADGPAWRPLATRRRGPNLGPQVELDFGEPVVGYLQLLYRDAPDPAGPGVALLRFGESPAPPAPWPADEVVVPIPAAGHRLSAAPRRFRYVAVVGLPGLFSAQVLEIDPRELGEAVPGGNAKRGVFGLVPPASGAAMQHEIWRELERLPGVVLGQGG